MAIENGYATQSGMKTLLGITKAAHDADIQRAVETASRWIDRYCGRRFYQDGSVTARTYSPTDSTWLDVHDVSTATGLLVATDVDLDGTFEQSWTADDYSGSYGFALSPSGSAADGEPWTRLEALNASWPTVRRGVKVTAKFGWAAVPTEVEQACLGLAVRLYKRKDAPFGVLEFPGSGAVGPVPRTDPDLLNSIGHLRRMDRPEDA